MVDADEVQHFALSLGKSAVGIALTLDCRSVLIIGCVLMGYLGSFKPWGEIDLRVQAPPVSKFLGLEISGM